MSNASSKKQSARTARSKKPVKRPAAIEQVPPPPTEPTEPKLPYPAQYAAVNWGPWRGLWMIAASFVGGQVLTLLLISFVPLAFNADKTDLDIFFGSTVGQFVTIVLAYGLASCFLYWFLRKRHANNKYSIGLIRPWRGSDFGYAFLGFLAYFALFAVIGTLIGNVFQLDPNQQQATGFESLTTRADMLMAFVSLVLLPPVVEEILFRGVLFGGLRRRFSFVPAMLLTSAFFAIPHLLEAKSGGLLWIAGVDTLVLSFVLCYLREKTGSLWASIILHMTKNFVAFLTLFVFVR